MTGVGGFGYFDPQRRKYHTQSPPEISKSSASAMLVERDGVWLGLKCRGEWGDSSAGIARIDRATQTVASIPLHEIVGQIVRVGEALIMTTDFGIAILQDGKLRRFLVDETTDGRLRVVEGISIEAVMQ